MRRSYSEDGSPASPARAEYPADDTNYCPDHACEYDECGCSNAEPAPQVTVVDDAPRPWSADAAALASILIAGLVVAR